MSAEREEVREIRHEARPGFDVVFLVGLAVTSLMLILYFLFSEGGGGH